MRPLPQNWRCPAPEAVPPLVGIARITGAADAAVTGSARRIANPTPPRPSAVEVRRRHLAPGSETISLFPGLCPEGSLNYPMPYIPGGRRRRRAAADDPVAVRRRTTGRRPVRSPGQSAGNRGCPSRCSARRDRPRAASPRSKSDVPVDPGVSASGQTDVVPPDPPDIRPFPRSSCEAPLFPPAGPTAGRSVGVRSPMAWDV